MDKEGSGQLANPFFVDPANFNFRLLNHSPAIDSGTPVGVDKDFDGLTRPAGQQVDIGAYEFPFTNPSPSPSPSPTPPPSPTPSPTPSPVVCPSDINSDGIVDLADYAILSINFLINPIINPQADINKDNIVDLSDYAILAKYFLKPYL